MDWRTAAPPGLDDFERLARNVFETLPRVLRERCDGVLFHVQDFAEAAVLAEMGIEDPFELTGLYQGVDLTAKSLADPAPEPDMVFLYRRPILDEWIARGDVDLGHLIAHVLIHEIGHHFGFSDDDMHALEEGD